MPDYSKSLSHNHLALCVSQQAFHATVAINHFKKMQLAHSVGPSDTKAEEINGNMPETNHVSPPPCSPEMKSHVHSLKTSQTLSQFEPHHAPPITEQVKHIYQSEPANLNRYVSTRKFF